MKQLLNFIGLTILTAVFSSAGFSVEPGKYFGKTEEGKDCSITVLEHNADHNLCFEDQSFCGGTRKFMKVRISNRRKAFNLRPIMYFAEESVQTYDPKTLYESDVHDASEWFFRGIYLEVNFKNADTLLSYKYRNTLNPLRNRITICTLD